MKAHTGMTPVISCCTQPITVLGTLDTMDAKISMEIPLPIPFSVILSPSHIRNAVPPVAQMPMMPSAIQLGKELER